MKYWRNSLKKFTGALIKLITRLKICYKGLKNLLQDVSVAFATLFTHFFFKRHVLNSFGAKNNRFLIKLLNHDGLQTKYFFYY